MKTLGIGVGAYARSVVAGCWLGVVAGFAGCSTPVEAVGEPQPPPVGETTQALGGTNLGGTNLGGTNLGGTNLGGTNLGGANLGGNNLGGTNLGGTNLGGTNLGGNNLGGNNLGGTNLGGTNLGGTNLGGTNLGGTNLGGTNLGGTNLGGTNLGGNNLGGTNLGGTNLGGTNSGSNIHALSGSINGMLYSGEDLWMPAGAPHNGTKSGQCVVMGIGSTAFAKLLGQQSANAKISVALGKLPWGFANTSGGAQTLKAWEAVVWGDNTYCTFVLAAPTDATWAGVAGFMKAIFRWNAPPSQSMDISGIEASAAQDSTLQTTISTYTGMMDAASKLRAGTILENAFITGELAFVTATTNNQSVMVDFSSWIRDKNGNALVLGNVQSSSPPTYVESVYIGVDTGNTSAGVLIDDGGANWWAGGQMPAGMTDSTQDLDDAYEVYQFGGPKPTPLRCGGTLFLNASYGEPVISGKCDTGVVWPINGCITGLTNWSTVSGTTAPMNTYMALTQSGGQYKRATDNTCNLKPVISETYVHMWGPSYTLPSAFTVDDRVHGSAKNAFNLVGTGWESWSRSGGYQNTELMDHVANDYVTFTFTGTSAKFYGTKDMDCGIGAVSLDGGAETNIDFYASTRTYNQLLWTSPTLPSGNHTFKLRVTGSKNASSVDTYVVVDHMDVTNPSTCTAETDAAFCSRLGDNCGSVTAPDNCGTSRTVSSCGTCTSPQTCGGAGTANVCGTPAPVDRTSSGTSAGTGTACNTTSETVAKAYDDMMTSSNFSKWCITSAPSTSVPISTMYDFSGTTAYTLHSYTITTANDDATRDPKNWTFQGCTGSCTVSSDTGWVTLDTRTNQFSGAARYQTSSFAFSNSTAYQQYRLRVTANNGNTSRLQMSEIQMFE